MIKNLLKKILPSFIWQRLKKNKAELFQILLKKLIKDSLSGNKTSFEKTLRSCDLDVSLLSDYYSPLPNRVKLKKNARRWFSPSSLFGVNYNLDSMKSLLIKLTQKYIREYLTLSSYKKNAQLGYGPGFTAIDAMFLYLMIRCLKPKRYIEVGSGLSTYYCSLAAKKNAQEGKPVKIICIDPFPYKNLYKISQIKIIKKEVQDLPASFFGKLTSGDILFIDSSHIVKIDGDVPYLYLELLPKLKKGVVVHIHDIPFPYNIPFPPQFWIFKKEWPVFWNEAMLLQAFLCFNNAFSILLSIPLLRFYDKSFLAEKVKNYHPPYYGPNVPSSIWIKKIK